MATMRDVAEKAGVSISTVSYVINGTRPISKATRDHIFAVMKELGFKPHAMARALASRRSRILALLLSPPERGLGMTELDFVTHAAEAAKAMGYHLVLWTTEIHDRDELLQFTSQGLVDGLILMEIQENDTRVNLLREIDFPFSMIGRCRELEGAVFADIDFIRTTEEAVRHLAELGHGSIGFINQSREVFDSGYGPSVRVHNAFFDVCARLGLRSASRFCHASPADGRAAFLSLREEISDLTSVLIMNDRAVPGVIQAVSDLGLRIPHDLSLLPIVSSSRLAEMFLPPLTTMDVPSSELGRLAVRFLIERLEGSVSESHQVLVPCTLAPRGSTGPAPLKLKQ